MATMNTLLAHFDKLDATFDARHLTEAFAFGAACAERQWPIYARASEGKLWQRRRVLRITLDSIWDWLLGIGPRPQGQARLCEDSMLEEMEGVDDATTAAFDIAGSFFELAYGVENNSPSDCVRVAIDSLELLHGYLDELAGFPPFGNNDTIVDEHELIQQEIRRQEHDVRLIMNTPLRAAVEQLREGSRGQSILGDYWYV